MAVRKLSISLDERAEKIARESAEREGVSLSAWLSRAAEKQARIEDGLRAVAEWEDEHGPISAEESRRAEQILDYYGVGSG